MRQRYSLIAILVLLLMCLCLSGCVLDDNINSDYIEIKEGYLDLTDYNFEEQGTLKLNGEWEFYWNDFLESEDFANGEVLEKKYELVPSSWVKYHINKEPLPLYGYATFRILLKLPDIDETYGLQLNRIFTAYNLWIDGQLYTTPGQISTNIQEEKSKVMPTYVFFRAKEPEVELIIQVSNHSYYQSGILDAIEIGSQSHIIQSNYKEIIFDSLLAGIILGIGIYLLVMYFFIKDEMAPLWFGILCLSIFMQMVFEGEMIFSSIFSNLNLQTEETMQTIVDIFISFSILHLMHSLFNRKMSLIIIRVVDVISIISIIGLIILPFTYLYPIWTAYSFIIVFVTGYISIFLFKSMIEKVEYAAIIFGSFVFFGFTGIYDVLISIKILSPPFILPIGLQVFIFWQFMIIAKKYGGAFKEIKLLSKDLEISLNDLKESYAEIEQRVTERTEELKTANVEIANMNQQLLFDKTLLEKRVNIDGLTQIYNKNYAQLKLAEEIENVKKTNTPLTLCMLDIDYFKKVNDTFGHLIGDEVLKQISQIMIEVSRDSDIVSRYGGEEFLIIMRNTKLSGGYLLIERIRTSIESYEWETLGLKVTISGGIAQYMENQDQDILEQVDRLLYKAKEMGRNRIEK